VKSCNGGQYWVAAVIDQKYGGFVHGHYINNEERLAWLNLRIFSDVEIQPIPKLKDTCVTLKCSVCKKSGIRLWRQLGYRGNPDFLFCGRHIPYACPCFLDKDSKETRVRICKMPTVWFAAILDYTRVFFWNDDEIKDGRESEWLKLPIE
jgi:hypothetical protein